MRDKDIHEGMRVVVNANQTSYKKSYLGCPGTVIKDLTFPYDKFEVALDGEDNVRSMSGHFYFKGFELSAATDNTIDILEENNMQNITNYLNIAKIRFIDGNNSSTYEYANFDPSLKEGDMCVVKSAHNGLGVATVVEIINRTDIQTLREVVAKVDTEAYDLRVANRAQMAELKGKMKERAKQLQDIALYQMLAKDDPDMAALLNEYQSISGM